MGGDAGTAPASDPAGPGDRGPFADAALPVRARLREIVGEVEGRARSGARWRRQMRQLGLGVQRLDGRIAFKDNGEATALNILEAKGYRDFSTVMPVGRDFDITAKLDGKTAMMKVDPVTGKISTAS